MTKKEVKEEVREEKVATDEEILFPEVKINDIIIRPWTFGKLFQVSSMLDLVLDKAESKGLIAKFEEEGGFLTYATMVRLLTLASPEVFEIIKVTIEKDSDFVNGLDMATGIKIAMIIYKQNKEIILKNVFSPLLTNEKKSQPDEG